MTTPDRHTQDPDPRPFHAPPRRTTSWLRAQVVHEHAKHGDPAHDRRVSWDLCTSQPCESARERIS